MMLLNLSILMVKKFGNQNQEIILKIAISWKYWTNIMQKLGAFIITIP